MLSGIKKPAAIIACVIVLITLIHFITYTIDKSLIVRDSDPWFCIETMALKDGGTKMYYGLGYQIIKWNYLSEKNVDGKEIYGVEHGFEIHRFPSFVDWKEGPTVDLKFIEYNTAE